MDAALSGFFLALGLILAIGPQNAFVLRQGLRGSHVLAVCLVCAVSDAVLIAAGVAGFGALNDALPALEPVMRYGGALFLLVYGARSFLAAWRGTGVLAPAASGAEALWPVVATGLLLTWANPHVYLDTFVLIGSVAAQFEGQRVAFAAGAMTASFAFFFSLGYGARLLRPLFAMPLSWRVLDAGIGVVMWAIAAFLLLDA